MLVVGAGAAGMSCADGLAKHPDKFDVTIIGESRCPIVARERERATDGHRKGYTWCRGEDRSGSVGFVKGDQ